MTVIIIGIACFIIAFLLGQNFVSTFYTIICVSIVGFLLMVIMETLNQREISKIVKLVTVVICVFTFLAGIKPTLDYIRGKMQNIESKIEYTKDQIEKIERFADKN